MEKKTSILPIIIVSILLFGGIIGLAVATKKQTPKLDYSEFISCLAEKDVTFWGASWCSHCLNQKALFGDQKDQLQEKGVYIECSINGGQEQTQECNDAGIESYPTWDINGERLNGELTLETLAEKTQCTLPVELVE